MKARYSVELLMTALAMSPVVNWDNQTDRCLFLFFATSALCLALAAILDWAVKPGSDDESMAGYD